MHDRLLDATVFTLHPAFPEKLERVKADMLRLGPATVRAVVEWSAFDGRYLVWAIEGTHRTYASRILGIPLIVMPVSPNDLICDHDAPGFPAETTAGSIAEYAMCEQPAMEVVLLRQGEVWSAPAVKEEGEGR